MPPLDLDAIQRRIDHGTVTLADSRAMLERLREVEESTKPIRVRGQRVQIDGPFVLEAVGIDFDGKVKPIDQLTSIPPSTWTVCGLPVNTPIPWPFSDTPPVFHSHFTDRTRKVLQLAKQEADRLNHEWVGTEHVLLGLAKEGAGAASVVLKNLDVDLRKIRSETEKVVSPHPSFDSKGKPHLTERMKQCLTAAEHAMRDLSHQYIGTEHLLLGLLTEREGIAAQVLLNCGVTLEAVRAETLAILGIIGK